MNTEAVDILLVEDSIDDAFLLERAIGRAAPGQFRVRSTSLLGEALDALADSDFEVALLDLSLPDSHGLDTFLRIHACRPDLPVVVLTGNDDDQLAAKALQEGAQDYLIKGQVDGNALVRSVRYAIERQRSRSLEASNAALEKEISERKRIQEELQVLAAKLERSNQELQQFASVASHDLQEPLRKIIVFGDRLRKKAGDKLEGQASDYLERMTSAAHRMQSLIHELLAFSRVVSKARPFQPVDLGAVAGEVVGDLEVLIEKVHGRVQIESLPVIDADPMQVRQLFQNLIANALKFRREDAVPVVHVWAEEAAGVRGRAVRLAFQDNGIGFEEKYLDRIFAPFQRLHGRGEYEGSGMGLAICHRIVDRHGGEITARSTLGEGSTFLITLPVQQTEVDGAEDRAAVG
jgi:signal transduction histidine kinase